MSTDVQESAAAVDYDVVVVGAGPAGLTLANLLGTYGVKTLLIEQNKELIDYPRGVSMDDETFRVFQTVGLAEAVEKHTIPDQWIRYITKRGRQFASVEPRTREFGWPRRNSFIQPLVDKVLFEGLSRFPSVTVRMNEALVELSEVHDAVLATTRTAEGEEQSIKAKFIVGCDGGRSTVRKQINVSFDGKTDSTRWVVIDLANDPLGIPNAYLFCDPSRPQVSFALPHGIRRFEFMVFDHESDEDVVSPAGIRKLLSLFLPNPEVAQVIRARVYTHHARIASTFSVGRVLLAGDAAHLMPVWQGQGFNSGIRDASNIAWKLWMIVSGRADISLLSTYDLERRKHAQAMMSLTVLTGRIFSPTNRALAFVRDALTYVLGAIPPLRNYILQMRFKPMPQYRKGVVVPAKSLEKARVKEPAGRMFPQFPVLTAECHSTRLDDVVGAGWAVIGWSSDPRTYLSKADLDFYDRLKAKFITLLLRSEVATVADRKWASGLAVLVDRDLAFKEWFAQHQVAAVVLRPDRFVAAAATASSLSDVSNRLRDTNYFADLDRGLVRPVTPNAAGLVLDFAGRSNGQLNTQERGPRSAKIAH